jgi:hypothetical protein
MTTVGLVSAMGRARQRAHERLIVRRALRPTDVFLVGHPKSGNTWLAYMIATLLQPDQADSITLRDIGRYVLPVHDADTYITMFDDSPNPRVFRNERPRYPKLYPGTIYVVRDPRAVLVSYYHHYVAITDSAESIESFVGRYLADGSIRDWEPTVTRWDKQIMRWQALARRQRVLIVRYEDLISDRLFELRRLAEFIGLASTEAQLELAASKGAFDAMRADEEAGGSGVYGSDARVGARFIRRGESEGWRDELSVSLADRIVATFGPAMALLGYVSQRES